MQTQIGVFKPLYPTAMSDQIAYGGDGFARWCVAHALSLRAGL